MIIQQGYSICNLYTLYMSLMYEFQGIIPDMAISVTLRELVPIDVAKELTMTARMFTGLEAKDYGLVTK